MRLRISVAVLGSWLQACSASDSAPRDAGRASDASGDAGSDSGANVVSTREDELRCTEVQKELYKLMRSHQVCATDEDCVVEQLDLPCFEQFACTQAWSKSPDVEELKEAALSLRDEYEQSCHRCESPECALGPSNIRAFCDSPNKLCSYIWTRDTDAGAAPSLPASPFVCQTNEDCVIKWVGGCCTYPRCANVDAEFGRSACPDTACVDGFNSYDRCECRENICRTMFGETIVY